MINDPGVNSWPVRHYSTDVIIVFASYAILAYAAIVLARYPGSIATVWPANGMAIGLILSAPRARRLVLLATVAGANLCANLVYGDPLPLSLAFLPPNTLEVALGVALTTERRALRCVSDHQWFVRTLITGALLPPLLAATIGALTLQQLGFSEFFRVWFDWYLGDAIGAVAFLPLTLALRSQTRSTFTNWIADFRSLAFLSATALISLFALMYLPYPLVMISAVLMLMAFGHQRLTTMACAPMFVIVLALALANRWFIPHLSGDAFEYRLMFLSAMLTVISAQLAAVVAARQRAVTQTLSAVGGRMDEIVVFSDLANRFRWVNSNRESYWNRPNESVIGRTWQENNPPDVYEKQIGPMVEKARSGQIAHATIGFEFPARGYRTMEITMQPAFDEEGYQIGVLSCSKDVTEIKASQHELEKTAGKLLTANQSLEQFVQVASHDLREPLNTIVQFCQLIEDEQRNRLSDAELIYFDHVRAGAARMKTILDDVLQYIKLDDPASMVSEAVDLDVIVRQVLAALDATIGLAGAKVIVGPLGAVQARGPLVSLLMQNLISNAVKFVPSDRAPLVQIGITRTSTESRLSVSDNGIGIAAAKINELGVPFRRLQSRRVFEGTGLGLAICKRIAEQLGGRIEIRSELGKGSEFTFVLPNASPF